MRNFMAALVAAFVAILPVSATEVTLYNLNGEEITVSSGEAERLRRDGWYYFDEIYTVVYSEDGRSVNALTNRLDEWKNAGWYENMSDVRTTLYSEDGRSITVWNAEVKAYLAVGWYRTPEEVHTTLYSEDGREISVWNAEVEAYLAVGWYRNPEEVQTVLYNENGEEKAVWNAEVEAYLAAGWLRSRPGIDPSRPMLALTFDDGPGPYTDRILDCLAQNNAKATFFVVGNRLGRYGAQLKREAELGMEIGNHSWSHASLTNLGDSALASQINDTNTKALETAGVCPTVMRPPYGSHNAAVRSAAGMPVILWSIDTLDWKTRNADATYKAVIDKAKDGDIILMHDIHESTAAAVERIVPELVRRGFQLVTVSELGQYRAGGLTAGKAYSSVR